MSIWFFRRCTLSGSVRNSASCHHFPSTLKLIGNFVGCKGMEQLRTVTATMLPSPSNRKETCPLSNANSCACKTVTNAITKPINLTMPQSPPILALQILKRRPLFVSEREKEQNGSE
jgi:hypothetical protein